MADLDDFNTVNYAAWHFPCYKINCPKRNYVSNPDIYDGVGVTLKNGEIAGRQELNVFDLGSIEGASFAFLFICSVLTFVGCVIICGALCKDRGIARPYNQVSFH